MWIHWIQLLSLFVEGKKIGELLPFVKWGYVYIPTMVEERIKWNYIWQIQKGKMVVWGGLTKSWEKKRSEVKGKGKMERYTHLNAEFQRIASRDKKAFLRDQCKEIEENNRMGKTGDLESLETLDLWSHWKRPWCWERWKAGGEGDDRRWDGSMASPTQWIWVWVSFGSWWWTGKPGMLLSMGSQRAGQDWVTELYWGSL